MEHSKKMIFHEGVDLVDARKVLYYCFDSEGNLTRKYFEHREVGFACELNRIEEQFVRLQEKHPEFISYTYAIFDNDDKPLTEAFSNPLTVQRIGKEKFLESVRKRGGGVYFHDQPDTNLIDTF